MLSKDQQTIITVALNILSDLFKKQDLVATSPEHVKQFCQLHLAHLEYETFSILFLDNKNRLIKFEKMFRGTINSASVYPREVIKAALAHNASNIILTHNHPSGHTEPSEADRHITKKLLDALALLDIHVIDHIIVGPDQTTSFAEKGLL